MKKELCPVFAFMSLFILICSSSLSAKNSFMFQLSPQYMYEKDKNDENENITNEFFSIGAALYFEPVYINTVPFEIAPFLQHASGINGYYTKGTILDNIADVRLYNANIDYIFSRLPVHMRLTYIKNEMILRIPSSDDLTTDISVYGGAIGYYLTHSFLIGMSFAVTSAEIDNPIDNYTLSSSGKAFGGLMIYVQHITGTKFFKLDCGYSYSMEDSTFNFSGTETKKSSENHEITSELNFFINQQTGLAGIFELHFGDNNDEEGMTLGGGLKFYPLTQLAFYGMYKKVIPKNSGGDENQQFMYGMTLRI